jgi:hypothetical protein
MGVVLLYPKPEKGERDKKSAAYISAKRGGFSMDRIDAARKVLDYSRELALAVRAVTLDEALETVKVARIGPRKRSSPLSGHFIGRKARKKLSAKTNPVTIDAARENLMAKVAALRKSDNHTRRSSLHSDAQTKSQRRAGATLRDASGNSPGHAASTG